MTEEQALELASWIRQQCQNTSFGEVTVSVVLHDGKVHHVDQIVRRRQKQTYSDEPPKSRVTATQT
jgi:hypothetical protein